MNLYQIIFRDDDEQFFVLEVFESKDDNTAKEIYDKYVKENKKYYKIDNLYSALYLSKTIKEVVYNEN